MTNSLRPSSEAFLTVDTTLPMTRASCISALLYRLERDQGKVVMLMRASGEFFDALEEGVDDRGRAQVAMFEQEIDYAFFAELDASGGRRVRLRQSIGVEEEQV